MTTTAKKAPKTRSRSRARDAYLPPSADIVEISGREYIIAPLDEYAEWEEDRELMAIVEERLANGGSWLTAEEFKKGLAERNARRKK
jgi:hypothetical protein